MGGKYFYRKLFHATDDVYEAKSYIKSLEYNGIEKARKNLLIKAGICMKCGFRLNKIPDNKFTVCHSCDYEFEAMTEFK